MLVAAHDTAVDPIVSRSIMELRAVIGADAARWCARRARAGTADRLRAIVDQMDDLDGDVTRWGGLGFSFWDAVVDGADNVAYLLAYNTLREVGGALTLADRMPSAVFFEEWSHTELYRSLVDAIAAGDADEAGRHAGRLLGYGVAAIDVWLASLPAD